MFRFKNQIADSQFRSYDFLPRIGVYMAQNPTWRPNRRVVTKLPIEKIPDAPRTIWWIDNFGNFKTTLLLEDVDLTGKACDESIKTKFGTLPYFPRLKDVPDKETAVITGSSGLGEKRFLEIVVQDVNGSAKNKFDASVGDIIFNSPDQKVRDR